MATWTPDLGLLKALITLNKGDAELVITPPDQDVMRWAEAQGYRVAVVAGVCEIRAGAKDPPWRRLDP